MDKQAVSLRIQVTVMYMGQRQNEGEELLIFFFKENVMRNPVKSDLPGRRKLNKTNSDKFSAKILQKINFFVVLFNFNHFVKLESIFQKIGLEENIEKRTSLQGSLRM